MTRQKKELNKQIEEATNQLYCEIDMGCGFMPTEQIERFQSEIIYPLYEQLAVLSHYNNTEEMLRDVRGCFPVEQIDISCDVIGTCNGPSCSQFFNVIKEDVNMTRLLVTNKACDCEIKDKNNWCIVGYSGKKKVVYCNKCNSQWITSANYLSELRKASYLK